MPSFSLLKTVRTVPSVETLPTSQSSGMTNSGSPPVTERENSASAGLSSLGFFPPMNIRLLSGDHPTTEAPPASCVIWAATDEFTYRTKACGLPSTFAA